MLFRLSKLICTDLISQVKYNIVQRHSNVIVRFVKKAPNLAEIFYQEH